MHVSKVPKTFWSSIFLIGPEGSLYWLITISTEVGNIIPPKKTSNQGFEHCPGKYASPMDLMGLQVSRETTTTQDGKPGLESQFVTVYSLQKTNKTKKHQVIMTFLLFSLSHAIGHAIRIASAVNYVFLSLNDRILVSPHWKENAVEEEHVDRRASWKENTLEGGRTRRSTRWKENALEGESNMETNSSPAASVPLRKGIYILVSFLLKCKLSVSEACARCSRSKQKAGNVCKSVLSTKSQSLTWRSCRRELSVQCAPCETWCIEH